MKKLIKEEVELPFEINNTYTTKFQTKERFTITRMDVDRDGNPKKFYGIYENHPHLGECPLNGDRLIPYKKHIGVSIMTQCPHCKELFKEE